MMQNSAKQVEGMVRQKMDQKEYILLCLEDTNDWSNATTRRLVMQVRRPTTEQSEGESMRCLVRQVHTVPLLMQAAAFKRGYHLEGLADL